MTKMIDLGWYMGRLEYDVEGEEPCLYLANPACSYDGIHEPASSFAIHLKGNLLNLKTALDEMFEELSKEEAKKLHIAKEDINAGNTKED